MKNKLKGWFKPTVVANQEKLLDSIKILSNIEPDVDIRQESVAFSIEKDPNTSINKHDGNYLRTKSRKPTKDTGFFQMSLKPVTFGSESNRLSRASHKFGNKQTRGSSKEFPGEQLKQITEADYDKLNKELLLELESKMAALARNQAQSKAECLSMTNKLEKLHTKCTNLVLLAKNNLKVSKEFPPKNNHSETNSIQKSEQITRKGSKERLSKIEHLEREKDHPNREDSILARMPKKKFTAEMSNTDQPSVAMYSRNPEILQFQSFRKSTEKHPSSSYQNSPDKVITSENSGSKRLRDPSVRAKIARQRTQQDERDLSRANREDFSSECETPSRTSRQHNRGAAENPSHHVSISKQTRGSHPRSVSRYGPSVNAQTEVGDMSLPTGILPKQPNSRNSRNPATMCESEDAFSTGNPTSEKKLVKNPIHRKPQPTADTSRDKVRVKQKASALLSELGMQ